MSTKALASIATAAQETFAEIQPSHVVWEIRIATKLSKIVKPRLGIQARCPSKKDILLKINEAVSVAKLQYE